MVGPTCERNSPRESSLGVCVSTPAITLYIAIPDYSLDCVRGASLSVSGQWACTLRMTADFMIAATTERKHR